MSDLSEWTDLIMRQGKERGEQEKKRRYFLDKLIIAMEEIDPNWWISYHAVPHYMITKIIRGECEDEKHYIQEAKRKCIEEYIIPAISAGIKAGFVTQVI